jgi:serine/threonine-protein kinase
LVKEVTRGAAHLSRRLLREARAVCTVMHPNVVRVDEILEHEGSPVMVMELLRGESLAARLERDGELSLEVFAPLMQQIVSAVGCAHALGVVHRDLKPENIFLVEDDDGAVVIKVLDFGIAKLAPSHFEGTQSTELTKTGALVGTPCYMAPEQIYGERDVDGRADIWAIALIMYRALSGILPTQAENVGQIMKIITTRGIWPLEEANPELPEDVTRIVNQMLVRDRQERPQSLHALRDVLAAYTAIDTPAFDDPINAPPSVDLEDPDSARPGQLLRLRLHTHADAWSETARGSAESLPLRRRLNMWHALLLIGVGAAGASYWAVGDDGAAHHALGFTAALPDRLELAWSPSETALPAAAPPSSGQAQPQAALDEPPHPPVVRPAPHGRATPTSTPLTSTPPSPAASGPASPTAPAPASTAELPPPAAKPPGVIYDPPSDL